MVAAERARPRSSFHKCNRSAFAPPPLPVEKISLEIRLEVIASVFCTVTLLELLLLLHALHVFRGGNYLDLMWDVFGAPGVETEVIRGYDYRIGLLSMVDEGGAVAVRLVLSARVFFLGDRVTFH